MRYKLIALTFLLTAAMSTEAQLLKKLSLSGIYLQWGYNREWYSKSDIHLTNGAAYDFTLHNVTASDKPDFDAITNAPLDISIPQYNYRIGFYLNADHSHAIELNFDHTKYVVTDYQTYHVTGRIGDQSINADTTFDPSFFHFEHTDGANFAQLNYVGKEHLLNTMKSKRELLSVVYKLGAGLVIPRTDVTYNGKRINNKFHVAGYIISAEAGVRVYPLRRFFLEGTAKAGFANYINSLASEGGKASHKFTYFEVIGLVGYEIELHHKKRQKPAGNS